MYRERGKISKETASLDFLNKIWKSVFARESMISSTRDSVHESSASGCNSENDNNNNFY